MLKNILSEINFRSGRRSRNIDSLKLAVSQNRYNLRPALELSRLGVPDAIFRSISMALGGLRDFSINNNIDADITEFLALTLKNLQYSRGQCFQDIAALYFAEEKRDGYFVEVGTGSGEILSNTFMLEKHFGWKGLLFEPDRRFHESIHKTRSAILDSRPVYSSDDKELEFIEVAHSGELSTLKNFHKDDGRSRGGSTHKVSSTTLNAAFRLHGVPRKIDFISIDTEGSELEVLKGLNFDEYSVRFFAIEHNYIRGRIDTIASYLAPHGFRPVFEELSAQDIWLINENF